MDDEITIIRVIIPGTNVVRITSASACIGGGGGTWGSITGTLSDQTDLQAALDAKQNLVPRVLTITSSATPTIDTDSYDAVTITALATAITSMTSNLSGTPSNFQKLLIRIKDDSTARSITWGSSFTSSQSILPSTTVSSKVTTVGLIWDSVKTKWMCLAVDQEP